jgi:hypothetical protein
MTLRTHHVRSHLFTLRVWPETSGKSVEWRGKMQYVTNGETLYFRDWEAMMSFLLKTLEMGVDGAQHNLTATGSERSEEEVK